MNSSTEPQRSEHRQLLQTTHRVVIGVLLASWMGVLTCGCGPKAKPGPPAAAAAATSPTAEASPAVALQNAIAARDWSRALELSPQAMIANPNDPNVLTNVAIATAQSGDRVKAAELLVEAVRAIEYSTDGGRVDNAIQALIDVGHLYDAIDLLQRVLEKDPNAFKYRRILIGFLGEAQRTEQVGDHMRILIQQRQFDLPLLLATTEMTSRRFSPQSISAMLERNPEDLRPRLGEARQHLDQRDPKSAEKVLREIIDRHPDFAAAHAMLGVALVTQQNTDAFPDWYASLPDTTDDFPGYWNAVGQWSLEQQRPSAAVRAFAEATRRAPDDSTLWANLGAAIRRLQSDPAAVPSVDFQAINDAIDRRRTELLELRERFDRFKNGQDSRSQSGATAIAETLVKLGRNWEAEAWLAVAMGLTEDPADTLAELRSQVVTQLRADRDWQSKRGHPELSFALSAFPLPADLVAGLAGIRGAGTSAAADALPIQFAEESASRSLDFYGEVGTGVEGPRVPIAQTLGCGGGAIDFDHDGHTDLLFAAAGGTIRGSDNQPGALFRNLGDHFADATVGSGFGDPGFSHGITVCDYNDDGFQDVLILNLGPNRLFRNNGDGTFADASDRLGQQGEGKWSTSGALVDIDGDGNSDFVVVNYCDANEPLEQPCFDSSGQEINCYPLRYRAEVDQFLRGTGDGSFSDATAQWNPNPDAGRGLGIIAGKLDGQRQCVYIVNDASINSFYRWNQDEAGSGLVETGVASGVAVDAQSLDQGSMGIATADFDNDGDLDFYVTGFAKEYNIFYEQQAAGFWSDRTAALEMVDPTWRMVGFGAEAIDMDNNGSEEIVVTNGHIGDFGPDSSSPFQQPLQVFRRSKRGTFEEADLSHWGEYFRNDHIGRCLFSCDLDSDGRGDFVVTHATEPVALLVNRSQAGHHRIVMRLVDTQGSRDATGAVVRFEVGQADSASRTLFQLAGHGYLCSNQVDLFAGLGRAEVARDVRVTWPDGQQDSFGDLESDAQYVLTRGEPAHTVRRFPKP